MADKGLVLKAIEAKLKGKSLSKNFKENLASKWAEKIENDEDIEAYVDDREDILLEASSEADRRAVAAVKKVKESKVEKVEEEPVEVDDDAPAWAKALIKQNQDLASEIEAFKSQQKSQSIAERFKKDERIAKLKGLPDHAFIGRIPQTEEEYEQAVEAFTNDWEPFLEKYKLGEQGGDEPASGKGATKAGETKKISADDAKAIVASMGSI